MFAGPEIRCMGGDASGRKAEDPDGDRLVSTEDLNAEQKARVATWLKTTYLNELFKGKAEFREAPATAK